MTDRIKPRFPIYIPSKGREESITARFLREDDIPFFLVVEEEEHDKYAEHWGGECILVLPPRTPDEHKSVIFARNWIKQHSTAAGDKRHWQLDDNINKIYRYHKSLRIPCDSAIAITAVEDFTEKYKNVAVSGLDYKTFCPNYSPMYRPFKRNVHVYSFSLTLNELPYRWRGHYNEDTDYCLQVLAGGWCTILVRAFLCEKARTMIMKGGNSATLYKGDGRLKMARSLERLWPGIVETKRRYGRPQHVINWAKFRTPLEKVDSYQKQENPDPKYKMQLKKVKEEISSPTLQKLYAEANAEEHADTLIGNKDTLNGQ